MYLHMSSFIILKYPVTEAFTVYRLFHVSLWTDANQPDCSSPLSIDSHYPCGLALQGLSVISLLYTTQWLTGKSDLKEIERIDPYVFQAAIKQSIKKKRFY